MQGLKNKIVVVTGAGQGIGKATAIRFANEGSKVVVAEYNSTTGNAVVDMITESGGNSLFVQVDISNRKSVQKMVSETMKKFGRIDVLVNNAGVIDDVTLKKMTDEQFDRVVNVNMKGTFICAQEVATIMQEQEYGVILNAASVVALYGNFGQTNYVASKAGIIGMTKVWARELGKYNIRVNAVAPGFIQTDMVKDIPEEVLTASLQHVPLKRMGQPEEVAATYCFLASDDACYITGTVISVDGGSVG